MQGYKHTVTIGRTLAIVSLLALLSACGGGGSVTDGATSGISSTTTNSGSTGSTGGSTTTASGSATGNFTLSWTAPVARTDGTPLALSEIAGYRVHYGTSRGNYQNHINITDGSLQSATLSGVPVGTYYVTMSTYDANGLESNYSSPVIKQVL
ncbi:MAG: fibronectin type III domain-containing protein [Pseudomonadota bacterium]